MQSHSPLDIKKANNARRLLTRKSKAAGKKKTYKPIHDDRLVRQPLTSYTYFTLERNSSGDLNGMTVAERGKLVGQEWKALSAAQKQVCTLLWTKSGNESRNTDCSNSHMKTRPRQTTIAISKSTRACTEKILFRSRGRRRDRGLMPDKHEGFKP